MSPNSISPTAKQERLPNLDGFRGLCILSVLGAHCIHLQNFPQRLKGEWFFVCDGALGVRFFFVLSGFIITWLLLREGGATGSICLKGFWFRRAVRILPAYGVFMITLLAIQSATDWEMDSRGWFGALTFTANYNTLGQWLPAHLWSLSVEEQFYLTWPIVLLLSKPWKDGKIALLCLSIVVISCFVFQWFAQREKGSALLGSYSFLLQSDSVAIGCIAAILLWSQGALLDNIFRSYKGTLITLFLLAIIAPKILEALRMVAPGNFPGSTSLQAFGLMGVLLWSQLEPKHIVFRILQLKFVVLIGTWSFSIYLWQQLFSSGTDTFGVGVSYWWLSFPGWLIPSIFIGMCSFYFIENPLRSRFGTRLRRAGAQGKFQKVSKE